MKFDTIRNQLAEIDAALDNGIYKSGTWQRFLRDAETLPQSDKQVLSGTVSAVSRKLHARSRHPQIPFAVALAAELVLLALGVILLGRPELIARLAGTAALALTLQPTIKILAGLLLGVRYDYAFLWYVEPRFKMRYGTYFTMASVNRVWFHLAGSVGTPVALFVGASRVLPLSAAFGYLCLLFAIAALFMQVGAFAAQWLGIKRVGGFRLSTLTSPATAAYEWQRMLRTHH